MIWQSLIAGAAIACCAIAAITAIIQMNRQEPPNEKFTLIFAICSASCIILLLSIRGWQECRIPVFGKLEALSFYSLSLFLSYIIMATRNRLKGVSTIVLPFILIVMATAMFGIGDIIAQPDASWPMLWLSLHVFTAFIGYGFFTTASILALIYLIQDHNLKGKHFGSTYETFPSLENLDIIMRRQIEFGFLVFTTAIILGVVMIHKSTDRASWIMDPKISATASTWVVYASLLHLRTARDQHGRKIAIATIVGFLFILFTFLGVHWIAESSHNFMTTPSGN